MIDTAWVLWKFHKNTQILFFLNIKNMLHDLAVLTDNSEAENNVAFIISKINK